MAKIAVAPLVGAWIEICVSRPAVTIVRVAPLVGAWIEIILIVMFGYLVFVAPLVGAWIEINSLQRAKWKYMSLPSWERGLKFPDLGNERIDLRRSPRGSVD